VESFTAVYFKIGIFKCALDGKPRPKAYCREKIQPKEKSRETVKVGITKELAV
jgi:hypothetical protein